MDLRAGVTRACLLVEAEAKKRCPVDLGTLRRSITFRVEQTGRTEVTGTVFTPVDYAPYVEYGTGILARDGNGRQTGWVYPIKGGFRYTTGMAPQPFLEPALEENVERIKETINSGLLQDVADELMGRK